MVRDFLICLKSLGKSRLQRAFHYQAFALGAAIMGGLFCLAGTGGGRIAIDAIIREQ
jgi:hypothetical protein